MGRSEGDLGLGRLIVPKWFMETVEVFMEGVVGLFRDVRWVVGVWGGGDWIRWEGDG